MAYQIKWPWTARAKAPPEPAKKSAMAELDEKARALNVPTPMPERMPLQTAYMTTSWDPSWRPERSPDRLAAYFASAKRKP